MQAESTCPWLPACSRGMSSKTGIQFPCPSAIITNPQVRRIDAHIDRSRFVAAARLDHPDIFQLLTAIFWKLDTFLRLLPRLTKVVAIAQEIAKEVAIIGGK